MTETNEVLITQILAEVDANNSAPVVTASQLMAEVDAQNSAPEVVITQLMAEVDIWAQVVLTVSQMVVEVDYELPASSRAMSGLSALSGMV